MAPSKSAIVKGADIDRGSSRQGKTGEAIRAENRAGAERLVEQRERMELLERVERLERRERLDMIERVDRPESGGRKRH